MMIVKITILLWFVLIVWKFALKVYINNMSLGERIQLEQEYHFYLWGWGLLLILAIVMSFASLIWLLFLL